MAAEKKATRAAYGETLVELVEQGIDVVAVEADLSGSTTTKKLGAAHPERLVNVGIAEQDMVGVAAGLSLTGHTAFTGSFAVFGTGRVYDQIRNTVCYANLNVKIAPYACRHFSRPRRRQPSDGRRYRPYARAAEHARSRSSRLLRCEGRH